MDGGIYEIDREICSPFCTQTRLYITVEFEAARPDPCTHLYSNKDKVVFSDSGKCCRVPSLGRIGWSWTRSATEEATELTIRYARWQEAMVDKK